MLRQLTLSRLRRSCSVLPDFLNLQLNSGLKIPWSSWVRGVKVQANEIRSGQVLEIEGRLLSVVKAFHSVGAGRQLGNVQMELRDVRSKKKQNVRQRPYDMVEVVRLESHPYKLLYAEGDTLHLMDKQYEQMSVDKAIFGDQEKWLSDGVEVSLQLLHDGEAVTGEVAKTLTVAVRDAGSYAKGDTAGASMKPCTLENGVQIMVPTYIKSGQMVVVDTSSDTFVKRHN